MRLGSDGKSKLLLQTGLVLLVVALCTRFFLDRQHVALDLADGLNGLVFGLAIGTLLLAIVTRVPRRCRW